MLEMRSDFAHIPEMEIDREKLLSIIADRRRHLNWSLRRVATESGVKYGMLQDLMRGRTHVLRGDYLFKVLKALQIPINRKSQVVGEVGAGAKIYPYDDHAKGAGLEEVDRPLGDDLPEQMVAVRVKGDSMQPQFDSGWLLFYEKAQDGVPPDCINALCVVKLSDESVLVKTLKQGSKPHLYHLISKNSGYETLVDQEVVWAAKVLSIRPA
jgi:phage repressor protein C with HTH and peptisase S24 domain